MAWLGFVWLAYMAAIAPVTVQIRFRWPHGGRTMVQGHVWGVPFQLNPTQFSRGKSGKPGVEQAWHTFRLSKGWLGWLWRKIRVEYVDLNLRIHTPRADVTALCWGLGEAVASAGLTYCESRGIPAHIVVQPAFGCAPTAMEGGCILFARLGNLLLAGLAVMLCGLKVRKMLEQQTGEDAEWITQSGA